MNGQAISKHRKICGAVAGIAFLSLMAAMAISTCRRVAVDEQKRRSVRRLKQIAKAILDHYDVHRRPLPSVVYTKEGKLLHSWRVLLLPFLGEEKLYREFKL